MHEYTPAAAIGATAAMAHGTSGASALAPVLAAYAVSKHFAVSRNWLGRPSGQVRAVQDVSLALAPGEVLGLVGESGCGKTSLARMLVKLSQPDSGRITLDGDDITTLTERRFHPLRRKVQMVFQDPFSSLDPRMTVGDSIAEGLLNFGLVASRRDALDRAADTLARVGLRSDQMRRLPHEFSGGQRQRVGIARAIAVAPRVVVCDEPVSALDVSVQAQVVNLLLRLQRESGMALLFVAHDLAVVQHISDRVAVMYLGRVVEEAPTDLLYAQPAHPYTRALLAATPRPEPGRRRQGGAAASLQGEAASPLAPPPGCAFQTRCPHAQPRCREERPALRTLSPGHRAACHFDID